MMERFEQDEYLIMAMFQKESRELTIKEIQDVLPFLEEDKILPVVNSTLRKMEKLTDQEFQALELESYREEFGEDV